jgi:hypothetical protein
MEMIRLKILSMVDKRLKFLRNKKERLGRIKKRIDE